MLQSRNRKYFTNKNLKPSEQGSVNQVDLGFSLIATKPKQYDYPVVKNVKPGEYIAKIDRCEFANTKRGVPALVVSYTLESYNDSDEKHFIKQSYPKDSRPLEHFNIAMTKALNLEEGEEYEPDDCIGVKEKVTLTYKDEDGFGNFSKREPIRDEEDNDNSGQHTMVDNTSTSQNMRLSPSDESLEDDEFEDFLDDEDE